MKVSSWESNPTFSTKYVFAKLKSLVWNYWKEEGENKTKKKKAKAKNCGDFCGYWNLQPHVLM